MLNNTQSKMIHISFSTVLFGCLIDTVVLIVQASTSSRLSTRGTAPWTPFSLWERTLRRFLLSPTAARGNVHRSWNPNWYWRFCDWLTCRVCVFLCQIVSENAHNATTANYVSLKSTTTRVLEWGRCEQNYKTELKKNSTEIVCLIWNFSNGVLLLQT